MPEKRSGDKGAGPTAEELKKMNCTFTYSRFMVNRIEFIEAE